MIEKLKKRTIDEIAKLPKEIQGGINSLAWDSISESIGKKFLLTEEEINKLQAEILLVLIGVEKLNNIKTNIEININTTSKTASQIGDETIEQIFKPIANLIELLIKNSLKLRSPNWSQSVNFIVSGGDYSVFLEK